MECRRRCGIRATGQLAAENGASPDGVTDIDRTTQGAGEGNDPHQVLTLVTGDW